jgi:hypothetical protein
MTVNRGGMSAITPAVSIVLSGGPLYDPAPLQTLAPGHDADRR